MNILNNLDAMSIFVGLLVLFTCLPVHEYAHAYTANKLGDPTPSAQGRLTLNPFAHLDLVGSVCIILFGFGWAKPVLVNPANFSRKRSMRASMAMVSAAGPISNIIIAFILMAVLKLLVYSSLLSPANIVITMITYMILINLRLGIFNMLPVPPLDGSKILAFILPDKIAYKMMEYERYIYIGLLFLMITGALSVPISFLSDLLIDALDFLTLPIDKLFGF